MTIAQLISRAKFVANRAIDKFFIQPHRLRSWSKKTSPFVHQNHVGLRFKLYPPEYVDQHIFQHGFYERRFLEILVNHFPYGAIALDIGANIGNHSICLANSFSKIHAFEPNPRVLARLVSNIDLNKIKNIDVHDIGLGKESAVIPFRENNDGNLGASGFLRPKDKLDALSICINLKISHADSYISKLNLERIDFIKVDVEGWEPELFEGMADTIQQYRPIIAFEFHGQSVYDGDYDRIISKLPEYIIVEAQFAPENATILAKIFWNGRRKSNPIFVRVGRPESRTYENILAFPNEAALKAFSN